MDFLLFCERSESLYYFIVHVHHMVYYRQHGMSTRQCLACKAYMSKREVNNCGAALLLCATTINTVRTRSRLVLLDSSVFTPPSLPPHPTIYASHIPNLFNITGMLLIRFPIQRIRLRFIMRKLANRVVGAIPPSLLIFVSS
jgi:hypothetical protein